MYFWCGLIGHVCISGHVFLQLSSSSSHLTSILQNNSSWQTDMRTHRLKSMASGPLKIEKGTRPVLILATHRHTTESVPKQIWTTPVHLPEGQEAQFSRKWIVNQFHWLSASALSRQINRLKMEFHFKFAALALQFNWKMQLNKFLVVNLWECGPIDSSSCSAEFNCIKEVWPSFVEYRKNWLAPAS